MRHAWHAFLRLLFRLLYNEFAWSYDLVAWLVSLGQWEAWGQSALSHLQGKRVLELGHGPGHLLVALAQRGFAAAGLDLSPNMARQAKRRLRRADLAVPLARARAQALPFRRDSFDSVVATFPTDFILHPQALREASRVLTPHGRLVIALTVRFEGEGLASRLLTWLYRVTGQHQPSSNSCMAWLEQAGLSTRIVWEQVNRAAVMLVIAEKD
jgi:ubiquinone/menaquinone biosynthesis C-methylase UbiE